MIAPPPTSTPCPRPEADMYGTVPGSPLCPDHAGQRISPLVWDDCRACQVTSRVVVPAIDWGTSWAPVNLTPYLDGTVKPSSPSVGAFRNDGVAFLYPGKEHAAVGGTESGKSWFALMCCARELIASNTVVYVHFEEADPFDTVQRLQLLGVPTEDIRDRFLFVGPEAAANSSDIERLTAYRPVLVILDGVNEAMALHGQGINDADGAAAYRQRVVKPFTATGAAVLSLDHVVKDEDKARSGYGFGSVHKINGLTGAQFLFENTEAFGTGQRGASYIKVAKDRPGYLRKFGVPTKVARLSMFATLVIDSTGTFDAALLAPKLPKPEPTEQERMAEFDNTVYDLAAAALTEHGEMTKTNLASQLPGIRRADRFDSLARLAVAGRLVDGKKWSLPEDLDQ